MPQKLLNRRVTMHDTEDSMAFNLKSVFDVFGHLQSLNHVG